MSAMLMALAPIAIAQKSGSGAAAALPHLSGVYQAIPAGTVLAGGLRNAGSPMDIVLTSAGQERMKNVDVALDPEKMCQPIGPFRMMAKERTKIEIVAAPALQAIVMLFEDISHGYIRTIFLNRVHPEKVAPTWQGDSVGRVENDVLVIDTIGFNDRTWLNDAGALHSDALHLVERIRPILGGRYLEYKVTADDREVLAKPYTYTRYYERLTSEIAEDVCEE